MPLLLLACLLCTTACNSQPDPAVGNTATEAATLSDGEPIAEYVVDAFVDSKGGLWFGTIGKGVAHHDGNTLTFLSPADGKGGNVVSSIAEDSEGKLWFAGHEGTGLCRTDGSTITQLWSEESSVRADPDGNIWACKSGAVYRSDGHTLVPFALPIDRNAITIYAIHAGNASFKLKDSQGNWWFGTDGAGAYKYDPSAALRAGASPFTHFTQQDGLCSNSVNDIVEDDAGHIWFICMQAYQPTMTSDGGLCRYDGQSFNTFPDIEGLHHNDLYTLFKDHSGNLWIGATGVGVYRHDGKTFTLFNRTDRPDLNGSFGLQGMAEDAHGTLWCGFSGGLFRFDGERFVHVTRNGPWE